MANNRVAVLGDFNLAGYDTGNAELLSLKDYIRCFHYPYRGENPKNTMVGYEGDPVYVQIPFQVETAAVGGVQPVLGKVQFSIVAVKNGENDFVIETWQTDVSAACRSGNQQSVNINQPRGYISYPGDPYNNVSLAAAPWANSGTKLGFVLQYGFVLRYDYWNSILPLVPGGANCNANINNDIKNVNNAWSNLQTNGWTIVARFYSEVTGYDGTITPFQAQTTISCNSGLALPAIGPYYAVMTKYFDINGNAVNNVIAGSKTRVQVTFTSNGVAIPSPSNDYWGTIWGDLFSGGPTTRRFASTEYAYELGTPFSNPGSLLTPATVETKNIAGASIIMGVYTGGIVILETIYDDTVTGWGTKASQILMMGKLGFKANRVLQDSAGRDILDSDGQQIIP